MGLNISRAPTNISTMLNFDARINKAIGTWREIPEQDQQKRNFFFAYNKEIPRSTGIPQKLVFIW